MRTLILLLMLLASPLQARVYWLEKDFGAVEGGDISAPMNAAIAQCNADGGGTIYVEGNKYQVLSSIDELSNSHGKQIKIVGCGTTLTAPAVLDRPWIHRDATHKDGAARIEIEGFKFKGGSAKHASYVTLERCRHSVIRHCDTHGWGTRIPFDFQFAIESGMQYCTVWPGETGVRITNGRNPGDNWGNAASNAFTLDHVRFYGNGDLDASEFGITDFDLAKWKANDPEYAALRGAFEDRGFGTSCCVLGVSGARLTNCIFEGREPLLHDFAFVNEGTLVHNLSLINSWHEHPKEQREISLFGLYGTGEVEVEIDGINRHSDRPILYTSCKRAWDVSIDGVRWMPEKDVLFDQADKRLDASIHFGPRMGGDPLNPAYWLDGIVGENATNGLFTNERVLVVGNPLDGNKQGRIQLQGNFGVRVTSGAIANNSISKRTDGQVIVSPRACRFKALLTKDAELRTSEFQANFHHGGIRPLVIVEQDDTGGHELRTRSKQSVDPEGLLSKISTEPGSLSYVWCEWDDITGLLIVTRVMGGVTQ